MTIRYLTGESRDEEDRRHCRRCDRFRSYVCAEHRKPSYADLEAEVERLQAAPQNARKDTGNKCDRCKGTIWSSEAEWVEQGKHYHATCRVVVRAEAAEAEVDRLRARTHEIQENADKRNADLHSQVERHKQLCREAHDWLGEYRQRRGIAWESVYEQFAVVNLIEDRERLRAIVDRLPKTADGVPVTPGMLFYVTPAFDYLEVHEWRAWGFEEIDGELWIDTAAYRFKASDVYSTREAAEAALKDVESSP